MSNAIDLNDLSEDMTLDEMMEKSGVDKPYMEYSKEHIFEHGLFCIKKMFILGLYNNKTTQTMIDILSNIQSAIVLKSYKNFDKDGRPVPLSDEDIKELIQELNNLLQLLVENFLIPHNQMAECLHMYTKLNSQENGPNDSIEETLVELMNKSQDE